MFITIQHQTIYWCGLPFYILINKLSFLSVIQTYTFNFNPNRIGVLGGGMEWQDRSCPCLNLLVGQQFLFYFGLKLQVFVMTKGTIKQGYCRVICFIKAVLLLCKHGHFLQKICVAQPFPNTIGLRVRICFFLRIVSDFFWRGGAVYYKNFSLLIMPKITLILKLISAFLRFQ